MEILKIGSYNIGFEFITPYPLSPAPPFPSPWSHTGGVSFCFCRAELLEVDSPHDVHCFRGDCVRHPQHARVLLPFAHQHFWTQEQYVIFTCAPYYVTCCLVQCSARLFFSRLRPGAGCGCQKGKNEKEKTDHVHV